MYFAFLATPNHLSFNYQKCSKLAALSSSVMVFLLQKTPTNNETDYKHLEFLPLEKEINEYFHLYTRLHDVL